MSGKKKLNINELINPRGKSFSYILKNIFTCTIYFENDKIQYKIISTRKYIG